MQSVPLEVPPEDLEFDHLVCCAPTTRGGTEGRKAPAGSQGRKTLAVSWKEGPSCQPEGPDRP